LEEKTSKNVLNTTWCEPPLQHVLQSDWVGMTPTLKKAQKTKIYPYNSVDVVVDVNSLECQMLLNCFRPNYDRANIHRYVQKCFFELRVIVHYNSCNYR